MKVHINNKVDCFVKNILREVGMATRRQKRRQARRTRKQRGGAQAFVMIDGKPRKTMSNATNKTTPRNLLQFLIEQYNLPKTSPYSRASQNEMINPAWQIITPWRIGYSRNYNNKWNVPLGDIDNREFIFKVDPRKLKNVRMESIQASNEILEKIFKLPEFQNGAKIITESSARQRYEHNKNVNQQFKFHKLPLSPILLLDIMFKNLDKEDKESGEFFKYLNFEEVYPLGEEKKVLDLVRFYKKEAGKKLEINPTSSTYISKEEKEKYLSELFRQAKIGLTLTHQIQEGQSAESFLEEKELFICCLFRDNYLNGNSTSALSLLQKIPSDKRTKFPIYGHAVTASQ